MVALTGKTLSHLLHQPSLMVPPEVRQALLVCWFSHNTLKGLEVSSSPIAVLIGNWIANDGLRPADAAAILTEQASLRGFGGHQFANELLAKLAGECLYAIKKRAAEAESEQRTAEAAKFLDAPAVKENQSTVSELSKYLSDLWQNGTGD